ncbi:MAG: argininosuccinate lyase [Nitrospirae bacterium]|nr:argininosuccinate lyase [Nitrospirota bacterium]
MKKLWGGRFSAQTEKTVEGFTESISFDSRLWKYDIAGSTAHVTMLGRQKIISKQEAALIIKGLNEIRAEIESGKFKFSQALEDVHMNIESALIKKLGPVGGKIHTARSRNDQVALDIRLYLRDQISEAIQLIKKLRKVFVSLAEKNIDTIMPGYTHLQRAQPVLLSHHLLAYFEMLGRDVARFEDCLGRVNVLPLGSAALAGTTLPIDRHYVAKLLKFPAVSENSIDAVSDRDFVAEFIASSSILMIHLSRLSEEFILWNSEEFKFIDLPDAFTTGSSIMPQKKNPDVLELTRGKTGRVYGNLMSILTIMKSLPLAYNRDMQEDKEPLFDTVDTVKACLGVLIEMLPLVRFNRKVMEKATAAGFLTATDLAEYLVKKGVPFRDAHSITGRVVKYCIDNNKKLTDMDLDELKQFSDLIGKDIFHYISVEVSVDGKKSYGGTSREKVLVRIRKIKS